MKVNPTEMYNENQKEKYLAYIKENYNSESHYKAVKNIFCTSCDVEKMFQKDLSLFDFSQIKILFEKNKWSKKYQFNAVKSHMIAYANWCDINQYGSSGAIFNFSRQAILHDAVVRSYPFKSIMEIQMFFYRLFKMDDDKYRNYNIMKYCLTMLTWSGFTAEEGMQIKIENIDLKNRIINYGDKHIHFSEDDFQIIEDCMNVEIFLVLRVNGVWVTNEYAPSSFLIKQKKRNDRREDDRRFYNYGLAIRKLIENLNRTDPNSNYNFSFIHLYMNGLFIRTYQTGDVKSIPTKYKEDYNEWKKLNF